MAAVLNGSVRRALFEWERGAREIAQRKHTMQMVARTLVGMGGSTTLGTLRRATEIGGMAAVVEAFEKRFQVLEAPPDLASAAHRRRALRKGQGVEWRHRHGGAIQRGAAPGWGAPSASSSRRTRRRRWPSRPSGYSWGRRRGSRSRPSARGARWRARAAQPARRARPRSRLAAVRSGIDAFQRTLAVRRIFDSQRRAASTLRYGAAARAAWNVLAEAGRLAYLERVQSRKRRAGLLRLVLSQWQRRSDEERATTRLGGKALSRWGRARELWAFRVLCEQRETRRTLHRALSRLIHRNVSRAMATWRLAAEERAERLVVVRRALNSLTQRGKATALRTWRQRCRDERRLRRRHLARGFDALCQAEMRGRRVRAIAARSARYMMHAATAAPCALGVTRRCQAKLLLRPVVWWAAARLPAQPARAGRLRTIKRAANPGGGTRPPGAAVAWRGATVQRRRVAAIAQRAFDYSDHSMMRNALLRLRVFKKFSALSRRAAMLTSEGKRRRALVDAFRKLRLAGDKFRTAARLLTKLATPMCLHLAFLRFATALRRQGRPSRKSLLLQRKAVGRWRMDDLRRCWHSLVCDTRASGSLRRRLRAATTAAAT